MRSRRAKTGSRTRPGCATIRLSRRRRRAGFEPITRAVVECAGVGVCTSDYGMLDFRRVRRPIFPLDAI
jgi:microcystin degradation protein MlrC